MAVQSKAKTPDAAVVRELMTNISDIADYLQIPFQVAVGIVWQESKFDPTSYRYNTSDKRDRSYGLFHLTLPTAQWMAAGYGYDITVKDLYDPIMSAWLGLSYLLWLWIKYDNLYDAISAYNAGRPLKTSVGGYINDGYIRNVLAGAQNMSLLGVA